MDKFYYLAAQLPLLKFAHPPFLTKEDFFSELKKWLTPKELAILNNAEINDFSIREGAPKLLVNYKKFERELRERIAYFRRARKNNLEYSLSGELKDILTRENPLEVEKKLLYLRWKFVEELEIGHYFDLEFFIVYFLKLQILYKFFTFNKDEGMRKFKSLCKVNLS
ncbi:MAG: DUF2764 domain-containing protein [Candidatus Omnitrophica bacterium]|nr:DUF2764 domain-containing protein [Candidatus Omnitrophota bacterium]MCM8823517.1 DUF2764 domain-containing protein [Candidatus Omnitrophota bacterium]MCM8825931.1 DUF2764 domain-containing protein [Candidatus Omnitrophota bacterium]